MIFSVFCGVSLFDLLLIGVATFSYFRNRRLQKQHDKLLEDLEINEEGQVLEKGVQEDNNAW